MHTGGVLLRRAGLRGLSRWLDVGARANSSSSRSTTLSKHNVLMEGIPRKSDKAGGIANIGQSIEASIVAKQRYTEAAYFRMDDNMKYAAMNEAERHPSSPSKPRPSAASMRQTPTLNLYEPPSLLRKDDWLRMLDEEFAEYDVDGIPPTLQKRIQSIKEKILILLEQTSAEEIGLKGTMSLEMKASLLEVDRKMIQAAKRMELSLPTAKAAEEKKASMERLQLEESQNTPISSKDVVLMAVVVLFGGTSYISFKICTDEASRKQGRVVVPGLVAVLEQASLCPRPREA